MELDPTYTSTARRANIYAAFLHNPFYTGQPAGRSPNTRQFISIKPRVKNEIKKGIKKMVDRPRIFLQFRKFLCIKWYALGKRIVVTFNNKLLSGSGSSRVSENIKLYKYLSQCREEYHPQESLNNRRNELNFQFFYLIRYILWITNRRF